MLAVAGSFDGIAFDRSTIVPFTKNNPAHPAPFLRPDGITLLTFAIGRQGGTLSNAVSVLALLMPTAAAAKQDDHGDNGKGKVVSVMTRNLYLGADLAPAIGAPSLDGLGQNLGVSPAEALPAKPPPTEAPRRRRVGAA